MQNLFKCFGVFILLAALAGCSSSRPDLQQPQLPVEEPSSPEADVTGMLGVFGGQAVHVADQGRPSLNLTLDFQKFVDRHTYENVTYGQYRGDATIDGSMLNFYTWAAWEGDAVDTPTEAYLQTYSDAIGYYQIEVERSGDELVGKLIHFKTVDFDLGVYEETEYDLTLNRIK